jgi:hypothetical protein
MGFHYEALDAGFPVFTLRSFLFTLRIRAILAVRGLLPESPEFPPDGLVEVMSAWTPQSYRYEGEKLGVSPEIIEAALKIIGRIQCVDQRLPIILTLRHLCALTDTPYRYLRSVVSRTGGSYKQVRFKKKTPGRSRYREVHIPQGDLFYVQKWISHEILRNTTPHSASYAYHPNSYPEYAATRHCGCRWLLKFDIEDFFHAIAERKVYYAFRELGYPRLLCFELARITTILPPDQQRGPPANLEKYRAIDSYINLREGFLPQGAPTSPMLSNLVMRNIDKELELLAESKKFKYTRYSDDLAFSTTDNISLKDIKKFRRSVLGILHMNDFKINQRKTAIRGPGTRRIVLGVLVDGPTPRLSKDYKNNLRQHLYYLCAPNFGPSKHAIARNMSISSLYHHINGKIVWAKRIEPNYGNSCFERFKSIKWPPFDIK